jgi:hypothetical protein
MEFNYDYGTHQWVLSIMVGFFLSKVITTLSKHVSNQKKTTFYLPYYLQMFMAFIYFIFVWYGYSPTMSIASEGKRLTFLLMIISDLIPVFFFQLVLADDEDLQKEHVDLEKVYFRNIKIWPVLAVVYFLVTSTNEYILRDVMPDSVMIKNSLNKVIIFTPIFISIYLAMMFSRNKKWHTYSGIFMCICYIGVILGY